MSGSCQKQEIRALNEKLWRICRHISFFNGMENGDTTLDSTVLRGSEIWQDDRSEGGFMNIIRGF